MSKSIQFSKPITLDTVKKLCAFFGFRCIQVSSTQWSIKDDEGNQPTLKMAANGDVLGMEACGADTVDNIKKAVAALCRKGVWMLRYVDSPDKPPKYLGGMSGIGPFTEPDPLLAQWYRTKDGAVDANPRHALCWFKPELVKIVL